jgi:hypothetical protein
MANSHIAAAETMVRVIHRAIFVRFLTSEMNSFLCGQEGAHCGPQFVSTIAAASGSDQPFAPWTRKVFDPTAHCAQPNCRKRTEVHGNMALHAALFDKSALTLAVAFGVQPGSKSMEPQC